MNRLIFKILAAAPIVFLLTACGGGGGGGGGSPPPPASPPPPVNQSPGGIWVGTDSEGDEFRALVTETGRFHFIDLTTGAQGSGVLGVQLGDQLNASFQFYPQVGFVFADGSPVSNCTVTGIISERVSFRGTVDCTTSLGNNRTVSINLTYEPLYDLDSSLGTFAGTWTDAFAPGIDVVNVDSLGVITGQDASGSNCIYTGQVAIIDSSYNAYDVQWTYSSCIGNAAALNGVTFSGIGSIDNSVMPTSFIVGATGVFQGFVASLVLIYEQFS